MDVIHIIIICCVVGGVVLIALTLLIIYCACRRARKKSRQNQMLDDTEDSQTKSSDSVQHTPICGTDNPAFAHTTYVPHSSNSGTYETSQSETDKPRNNLASDPIPKIGPASLYAKIGETTRHFEHVYNTSSTSGHVESGKGYVYGVDETNPYATVDIIHLGGNTRPERTCVIHDVTEHGADTASEDRLGHSRNVYYELERASNASSCTLSEADVQSLGPDAQSLGSDAQSLGPDAQSLGSDAQSLGPDAQSLGADAQSLASDVYANTNKNTPFDPQGHVQGRETTIVSSNDPEVKYLPPDHSLEDEMYVNNAMLTSPGAAMLTSQGEDSGSVSGDQVSYPDGNTDSSYFHFKETDDLEETWA